MCIYLYPIHSYPISAYIPENSILSRTRIMVKKALKELQKNGGGASAEAQTLVLWCCGGVRNGGNQLSGLIISHIIYIYVIYIYKCVIYNK